GTFHSVGVKILRMHAELVGLRPNFTILDTDDQLRLLKQLLQAENLDDKRWPARALAGLIDSWKNRGLDPQRVPPGESGSFAGGRGAALYAAYQGRLKALNAVDFGDLLLESLRLFREHPDVLASFQRRFRYILAVASGLIAHNLSRLGKTLFTDAPLGERPTVTGVWDSQEEARVIGDEIEPAQRASVSLDDIAILVRA